MCDLMEGPKDARNSLLYKASFNWRDQPACLCFENYKMGGKYRPKRRPHPIPHIISDSTLNDRGSVEGHSLLKTTQIATQRTFRITEDVVGGRPWRQATEGFAFRRRRCADGALTAFLSSCKEFNQISFVDAIKDYVHDVCPYAVTKEGIWVAPPDYIHVCERDDHPMRIYDIIEDYPYPEEPHDPVRRQKWYSQCLGVDEQR